MSIDPQAAAQAIVDRIVAQPHLALSDEEVQTLEAVPERTLLMEKVLAVHFHKARDFRRALPIAQRIFADEQNSENGKNVAHLMRSAGRVGDAIAFLEAHEDLIEPILHADMMCMMQASAGNLDEARRHGTRSLSLKDAAVPEAAAITPVTRSFDAERPRRNVIAFSLWGADRRYLEGAVHNAVVARYLYPGWTVRVYLDASVPEQAQAMLAHHGADLRSPPEGWPAATHGLFWRFLVEDDEDVDIFLIRDADSVMNIKERAAVEDWLVSGRAFHLMRDYPSHSELILAGMWGAHRGNIGDMAGRVERHLAAQPKRLNALTVDQEFLRTAIWPIVRQDVLMHDPHFAFGDPVPYRDELKLPSAMHIGQNDHVLRRSMAGPKGGS